MSRPRTGAMARSSARRGSVPSTPYRFKPAVQFSTTVIGAAVVVSVGTTLIRNFWPSAVTS
ncbi:MAG: hypothetical protein ABL986_19440 [Vicinamibacterales bacterium]